MLKEPTPGFYSRFEKHIQTLNYAIQRGGLQTQTTDWLWEQLNNASLLRDELNSIRTLIYGVGSYTTIESLARLRAGELEMRSIISKRAGFVPTTTTIQAIDIT
jgi:hypothetical protein